MEVETIEYNGIIFRRYPQSKNWADRNYFRPNGMHIKRGVEALHRELWKSAHGAIPDGYEVHHIDGDTSNNAMDNLECLSELDHQCNHERTKSEEYKQARLKQLDAARLKSTEWHATEEGKEHHKHLGVWTWRVRKLHTLVCEYCGKKYNTKDTKSTARFCSNNCKVQSRRVSGVDNEDRTCAWCSNVFRVNKYSKTRFCGGSCAAYHRGSERKRSK